jgi:site-specific recombinase XerD
MEDVSKPLNRKLRAPKQNLNKRSFLDGAIYLYQRGGSKKGKWAIRLKVPNVKGYIFHSSGTSDEHEAFGVAKNLYNDALVKSLSGVTLNGKRISLGLKSYIDQFDSPSAALSIRYKVQFARRLLPIFDGKYFDDLDTALISKMITELTKRSKKPTLSANTIKRNLNDFRHFLQWCLDNGYLTQIPRLPKVAGEQARRPHFTREEWKSITTHLGTYVQESPNSVKRDRRLLALYINIMRHTGIRVGEARELKWRDVRSVPSEDNPDTQNIVLSVKGKTGFRDVVCGTPKVIKYIDRILKYRQKDTTDPESDIYGQDSVPNNSFIFCNSKGRKIGSFKRSFNTLLRELNLVKDTHGRNRTIYSLRHTYATSRIEAGVDIYLLANNMGTSVAMIEKFYGHSTNVAMADELAKPQKTTVKNQANHIAQNDLSWITELSQKTGA